MKILKNNLRDIRKKKGMSQLELSYDTRISPSDISNIERGKQYPHKGWRKKISKVSEVDEEEIFPEISE